MKVRGRCLSTLQSALFYEVSYTLVPSRAPLLPSCPPPSSPRPRPPFLLAAHTEPFQARFPGWGRSVLPQKRRRRPRRSRPPPQRSYPHPARWELESAPCREHVPLWAGLRGPGMEGSRLGGQETKGRWADGARGTAAGGGGGGSRGKELSRRSVCVSRLWPLLQTQFLKPHRFMRFWRPEVQNGPDWAESKVLGRPVFPCPLQPLEGPPPPPKAADLPATPTPSPALTTRLPVIPLGLAG